MKCLIIDCNYVCHAIFHSMPALSFHHKYTQIIFGFIKKVISYAEEFRPNNIAFVWDSRYSIRKEIYPQYKQHRIKRDQEASEEEKHNKRIAHLQFTEIRETVLPNLGFSNVFMCDGYEGDDVMASITINNNGYKFIVITTDQDIYQLINDNCELYNPVTKTFRTRESFNEEYGCDPSLWGKAKSIAGCGTDNVAGVKGVAEKTAIKYLLGQLSHKSKKYIDIKSASSLISENEELIMLPMHGIEKVIINKNNSLSRKKFVDVCDGYGFRSLISKSNLDKWDRIVNWTQ